MPTVGPEGPDILICKAPGDLRTARWLRALTDREGLVMLDPAASAHGKITATDLGAAVLRSMGKSDHLNALKRKKNALALAWLCAFTHRSSDSRPLLVAADAQQLHTNVLTDLKSWSVAAGVDLCLVAAGDPASTDRLEAELQGARSIEWRMLRQTLSKRPRRNADEHVQAPGWRVPRVDGLIFRSTCRAVLSEEDFAKVDDLFVEQVVTFRRAFRACGALAETGRYETIIRGGIESAPSTEELIVRVRAAQVASANLGLLLTVDTVRLLAAAEGLCRRGLARPQRWWEELDRYQDPDPGALAALYHAGFDLGMAVDLHLNDVAEVDGGVVVKLDDREVAIDSPAAHFVVVQRHYRLLCGAAPDEPLFATFRRPGMTPQCAVNQLRLATAELGVDIIRGVLSTWHHNTPAYLARYGLRLHKVLKAPNSPRNPERPVGRRHRRAQ